MKQSVQIIETPERLGEPGRMANTMSTSSIAARFLAHPAPRVEAVACLLATGFRAYLATAGHAVGWGDAAVVAVMVCGMPFAEWFVHARVLHAKPRRWRGQELESLAAKAHRAHHADPRNERLILSPLSALLPMLPVGALALLLPSWGLRATAIAMLAWQVLATEWLHYMVHMARAPKSAWLRRRCRAHRLHHYRSDRYWFGIGSAIADVVLRTTPPAGSATPISPAAGRSRAIPCRS
jgi:Fatty acid hydroxylase superfamily